MGQVSEARQLSRCAVSPAEQVGKQIEGVCGWRACGGRAGMRGGSGGGAAIVRELLAHAVSSSVSTASIAAREVDFLLSIGCFLFDSCLRLVFAGSEVFFSGGGLD